MNKKITAVLTLALLALTLLTAAMPFLSFTEIKCDSVNMGNYFNEGKFTSQALYVEEYSLGIPWVIEYFTVREDISFIHTVQSLEAKRENAEKQLSEVLPVLEGLEIDIEQLESKIAASPQNEELKKSLAKKQARADKLSETADTYEQEILSAGEQLTQSYESYGGDKAVNELYNKLQDEEFSRIAGTFFLINELAGGKADSLGNDSAADKIVFFRIRAVIFTAALILSLIAAFAAALIMTACSAISSIKLIRNRKRLGEQSLFENLLPRILPKAAGIYILAVTYLVVSIGRSAEFAAPAIILLCATVICSAAPALLTILTGKKPGAEAVRNAITLLSLAALIAAGAPLLRLSMLDEYEMRVDTVRLQYYEQRLDSYLAELDPADYYGKEDYEAAVEAAKESAENAASAKLATAIPYALATALVFPAVIFAGEIRLAARLLPRGKRGTVKVRGALVFGILLFACSLIPLFASASTPEERSENDINGKFSVLFDAYKHSGTDEEAELKSELTARENILSQILNQEREYEKISDPEQKRLALKILEATRIEERRVRIRIDLLTTRQTASEVLAIITAAITTAAEALYLIKFSDSEQRLRKHGI